MTKKDYIKLAAAFAITKPAYHYDEATTRENVLLWRNSVDAVADVCKGDNPRFDHTRFNKACGV